MKGKLREELLEILELRGRPCVTFFEVINTFPQVDQIDIYKLYIYTTH